MGQAMLIEMLIGVCLFFVVLAGAIVFYHKIKEGGEDD
nr:MAG TPA: Geopilin domain 1 protein, PilA, bacterial nanowire, type [Caudoviricetes sp.]